MNKKLSFVIPCYRSEHTVMSVVDEIEETVSTREGYDYEIILVNDGSPDNVWHVIEQRAENDFHIIGINLAKNFGQQCALMAGYHHCSGNYIVSLDDDGQAPVSGVYALIDKLEEGYDVVYASYKNHRKHWIRKLGAEFASRTSDYIFEQELPRGSTFYVMRRFVVQEMLHYKNPYPYPFGLVLRITRRIGLVPLEHRDRISGESGYTMKALILLWVNSFTAFSVKPLRLGSYCGFFMSCIGFLFAVITVLRKLFFEPSMVAGWSSIISILLIVGGMILLMLGLIGEYIGRIYICLNDAPQFVIRNICGQGKKNYEDLIHEETIDNGRKLCRDSSD